MIAQKKAYETLDERLTTLELPTILDQTFQIVTAINQMGSTINQNIEEINGINELTTATAQELADSSQ
ncbi:hypothetical protein ACTFQ6_14565 [Aliivibrio fischeri]